MGEKKEKSHLLLAFILEKIMNKKIYVYTDIYRKKYSIWIYIYIYLKKICSTFSLIHTGQDQGIWFVDYKSFLCNHNVSK